jgi:hypothetical protein
MFGITPVFHKNPSRAAGNKKLPLLTCINNGNRFGTLHQKRYFAFFCYREHFLLHKPGVKMMTRGLFHFSGNLIE